MDDLCINPSFYYTKEKDFSKYDLYYKDLIDRLPSASVNINTIQVRKDEIYEKIDLILKNPSGNKELNIPTKKEARNWFKKFKRVKEK